MERFSPLTFGLWSVNSFQGGRVYQVPSENPSGFKEMGLSWMYLFTSSKISYLSMQQRKQPCLSMQSVHWWGHIRNKWLQSVFPHRNKIPNLASCSAQKGWPTALGLQLKKFLRSHQDVQLLYRQSFLIFIYIFICSWSHRSHCHLENYFW